MPRLGQVDHPTQRVLRHAISGCWEPLESPVFHLFPGTVGTGFMRTRSDSSLSSSQTVSLHVSAMVFARFPARLAQAPLTTRDCRTTHCGEVAADSYLFHDFFFVAPAREAIKGLCGARHSCM